jgi:hypothetical protein
MNFNERTCCGSSRTAGSIRVQSPYRGSNPPNPAKQSGRPRFNLNQSQKSAPMAAFRNSVAGLQTPDFTDCGPKWQKVSGPSLKYSRFPETPTGDRVRSALRGGPGVLFSTYTVGEWECRIGTAACRLLAQTTWPCFRLKRFDQKSALPAYKWRIIFIGLS